MHVKQSASLAPPHFRDQTGLHACPTSHALRHSLLLLLANNPVALQQLYSLGLQKGPVLPTC